MDPVEDKPNNTKVSVFNNKILLGVVGLVALLVVVGLLFWFRNTQLPKITSSKPLPKEVTVNLTNNGFEPQTVTIEAGSTVRWVNNNNTDSKASINSDDYPTNKKFPELNLGEFEEGKTLMHIFTTPGTYTYNDYFHHEFTGTVIVK